MSTKIIVPKQTPHQSYSEATVRFVEDSPGTSCAYSTDSYGQPMPVGGGRVREYGNISQPGCDAKGNPIEREKVVVDNSTATRGRGKLTI